MQFIWCIIFKIFYYVWEYEIYNVDRYIQIVYEVLFLIQQIQTCFDGEKIWGYVWPVHSITWT